MSEAATADGQGGAGEVVRRLGGYVGDGVPDTEFERLRAKLREAAGSPSARAAIADYVREHCPAMAPDLGIELKDGGDVEQPTDSMKYFGPEDVDRQAPVRQARSLRPKFKVLVELTHLADDEIKPVCHWLPGHYRKPESADIDASAVYEEDYLSMPGVIGHVAVVEIIPGEGTRLYSVRHFPEE